MAVAKLNAEISVKGARKATDELKKVAGQAKKTENNVIQMGDKFKGLGKQMSTAAAAINGPMGGVASRITAVTSLLSSGALLATGFGVAITGLGFAVSAGIKELDQMNIELAKTEAILKATGYASGKTADQLYEQARAVGLATLASTQGIQQAQAKLLTFDKIHGKVFDDAIELTQDLATVFGGDAAAQATQLGKALQDPVKGLTALSRVGVSFTKQQEDQIRAMVASGDIVKAQTVLVATLKAQVGGAGSAVAKDSLAGKTDTAGQLWSEFGAKLAQSTGSFSITEKLLDGMIGRLGELNELLREPTAGEYADQALEVAWALAEQRNRLDDAIKGTFEWRTAKNQVIKLEKEHKDLIEKATAAAKTQNDEMLAGEKAHLAQVAKAKADAETARLDAENTARIERDNQLEIATNAHLQREEETAKKSAEINMQALLIKSAQDDEYLKQKAEKKKAEEALEKANKKAQLGSLDDLTDNLKTTLGEQSAIFKAAAITQATINTYNSATGAYAALAPIPYVGPALGAAAAGVAIAAGFKNVQAITSARYQGGQLSAGQSSTIAEKGDLEIITPASSSRVRTKQQMEQIMGGSGGGNIVQLTVIDQSTGDKEYQQEQSSDGKIILLIRDTVSADLTQTNSQISKSMSGSYNVARRR